MWLTETARVNDTDYYVANRLPDAAVANVDTDFALGEIVVVYVREPRTNKRTVLFALVTLLSAWLEPAPELPRVDRDSDSYLRLKAGSELNVRRVTCSPSSAVAWYRSCASGHVILPKTSFEATETLEAEVAPLGEEPAWPLLSVQRHSGEPNVDASFCGQRADDTRTHHLLPLTPVDVPWNGESARVSEWLQARLHFDPVLRPHLLGSAHLVLTNPLFKHVDTRLAGKQNPKAVVITIKPWPGREPKGLLVVLQDVRPYGPTQFVAIELAGRTTEVNFATPPHMIRLDVYCPLRGHLHSSGPFAFLRGINLNMRLGGSERRIQIARADGSTRTLRVGTSRAERPTIVGDAHVHDATTVAGMDVAHIRELQLAASLGQQHFIANEEEAEVAVRKIIGSALKRVRIVDPYFGLNEFGIFGLANGNLAVHVDVLTSAEHLRGSEDAAARLLALQEQLQQVGMANPLTVRVAAGARAPIHDRFVEIDERVIWLLGASLNAFGSRGTVLVRLPNPRPIREMIDAVWTDTTTLALDEFLTRRESAP